jgi:microcin C transport system substrate-binding protein
MFHLSHRSFLLAAASCLTIATSGGVHAAEGDTVVATWFSDWGSAKYSEPFDHLDYVNPDAPKGGRVVQGTVGDFDSFNPYSTLSGSPAALSSIVYERLMASNGSTSRPRIADEFQSSSYCFLCETIEYPESKDWVIFNLRKDVTFSDGTPMTAEDVAFTHNKFIAEGTPSWRSGVSLMIEKVEVLDPYTVKFTFNPDVPRKGLIGQAGATIVMSKAWFEKTGAKLDEKRVEVSPGTGEYVLSGFEVGEWVEYERNPQYWGDTHPIMLGQGNVDTVRIEYFGDSTSQFEAFKSGEITYRAENSSLKWATGYDFPAIENGWVVKETIPSGTMRGPVGFLFNLRKEKFQDRRVREAIGLMYNFTWTNGVLQYGLFAQREAFWNAPGYQAEGLPTGKELEVLEQVRDLLPEETFTQAPRMPHASGDRLLDRRNLRKALALMDEAGWTPGDDGKLRNAAGETLEVEILHYSASWDRIINPYVENLTALGVDITYNRVDPNEYQARSQSFDYDIIYSGYVSAFEEDTDFSQKYSCEDSNDIFNPAGYCGEAIDEIGDILLTAETFEDMQATLRAADRILRNEYFIVLAHMNDTAWVSYYDMYEHPSADKLPPLGTGILDTWWVNEDKAEALKTAGAIK